MLKHVVIEISEDEARKLLIEEFADFLRSDRQSLIHMLANGVLEIPDFKNMNLYSIIAKFSESADSLGERIAKDNHATQVVMKTGEYTTEIVFDMRNLKPESQWSTWKMPNSLENNDQEIPVPVLNPEYQKNNVP